MSDKIETRNEKKARKPKRTWLKITLGIILLLVIGVGVYAATLYNNVKDTVNVKMHQPLPSIDHEKSKEKIVEKEKLNVLLLGVDKRGGDRGRSDSLIVLSLDPKTDSMKLISIPRDTRTEIVGKGFEDKINHAYAFGGPDMSIESVENLLNIDLDYYVQINMEGLSDLVDTLGGISLTNELDWYDSGRKFHYAPGELQLNGDETMGYVRMRYEDPAGDFGRTKRQRQVIEAIVNKGASIASVNKIQGVVDVLGNNMSTNMDFNVMKDLLTNYSGVRKNVENYMLSGSGTKIDGVYYLVVPDEEIQKVHGMIVEPEV
jgi:polyisoprenyl-teichoic acid--peptidoglycan teichoic acid transferase